jgi:hypothetical protein
LPVPSQPTEDRRQLHHSFDGLFNTRETASPTVSLVS